METDKIQKFKLKKQFLNLEADTILTSSKFDNWCRTIDVKFNVPFVKVDYNWMLSREDLFELLK